MSLFALSYFFTIFTGIFETFMGKWLSFSITYFLIPILGLIGAIIGGLLSYLGSHHAHKDQIKNERKNIAKVIDIDLKNIYDSIHFNKYYNSLKNDKLVENEGITPKNIELPNKLYDDKTLLYFVFTHDIAKLDYNLSSEIFECYNNLFEADKFWNFLTTMMFKGYESQMQNKPFDPMILKQYTHMKASIIKCGDKIPEIREKLKEVYNS